MHGNIADVVIPLFEKEGIVSGDELRERAIALARMYKTLHTEFVREEDIITVLVTCIRTKGVPNATEAEEWGTQICKMYREVSKAFEKAFEE